MHRRSSQPCQSGAVSRVSPTPTHWQARASRGRDPDSLDRVLRAKAKNLIALARQLVARYAGQVPRDLEALTALAGVGRKTANVVLGTAFGIASGVVVDTHVKRLAFRLGLTKSKDPIPIERDLMRLIPRKQWVNLSHRLILARPHDVRRAAAEVP